MNAIRIVGRIDEEHRLTADGAWQAGIAREWADDLADERQDIYDLTDGRPVNEAG